MISTREATTIHNSLQRQKVKAVRQTTTQHERVELGNYHGRNADFVEFDDQMLPTDTEIRPS